MPVPAVIRALACCNGPAADAMEQSLARKVNILGAEQVIPHSPPAHVWEASKATEPQIFQQITSNPSANDDLVYYGAIPRSSSPSMSSRHIRRPGSTPEEPPAQILNGPEASIETLSRSVILGSKSRHPAPELPEMKQKVLNSDIPVHVSDEELNVAQAKMGKFFSTGDEGRLKLEPFSPGYFRQLRESSETVGQDFRQSDRETHAAFNSIYLNRRPDHFDKLYMNPKLSRDEFQAIFEDEIRWYGLINALEGKRVDVQTIFKQREKFIRGQV